MKKKIFSMKKRKCKNKVVVFRIVKLSYSMKTTTMKYCILMKMVWKQLVYCIVKIQEVQKESIQSIRCAAVSRLIRFVFCRLDWNEKINFVEINMFTSFSTHLIMAVKSENWSNIWRAWYQNAGCPKIKIFNKKKKTK